MPLVGDASLMGSFNYLNFILRKLRMIRKIKEILKLGNFYESLEFMDENSMNGQLTDESELQVVLPKRSRIFLTGQILSLKTLRANDSST